MTKDFAKYLWRFIHRMKLRKQNIHIESGTYFNQATIFGGNNHIGEGSSVSNTRLGRFTYVDTDCFLCDCKIGAFTSIARNVRVEKWTHPTKNFISTSPVFFSKQTQVGKSFVDTTVFQEELSIDGLSCKIGNDVWIGTNVLIIGGTNIGDGAIVAAGSVVTRDIPAYAVVGGVPAKIIRYRYSPERIEQLLAFKWWEKPEQWLRQNASLFADEEQFFLKLQAQDNNNT